MPRDKVGKGLGILGIVAVGLFLLIQYSLPKSFPVTITYPSPQKEVEPFLNEVKLPALANEAANESDSLEVKEAKASINFPLELNSASVSELEEVPGIGPVTAQRIVEYKEVIGGYTSLEQLLEVKGIGEKTYLEISAYLVI